MYGLLFYLGVYRVAHFLRVESRRKTRVSVSLYPIISIRSTCAQLDSKFFSMQMAEEANYSRVFLPFLSALGIRDAKFSQGNR